MRVTIIRRNSPPYEGGAGGGRLIRTACQGKSFILAQSKIYPDMLGATDATANVQQTPGAMSTLAWACFYKFIHVPDVLGSVPIA